MRPGPGGGVFVGERSALAGVLRDVRGLEPDVVQVGRVLAALAPLIVADVIAALDDTGRHGLEQALAALDAARDGELRDFVEAGLEVFATIVSLPPTRVLIVMVGALLRTQIVVLDQVSGPIDADRRELVDRYAARSPDSSTRSSRGTARRR